MENNITEHGELNVYQKLIAHFETVGYTFICPSPETQARVCKMLPLRTPQTCAYTLEDVFGWSSEIQQERLAELLPPQILQGLCNYNILNRPYPGSYVSSVRISNLYLPHFNQQNRGKPIFYLHSAFPTTLNSAFFGPDTYLFLDFLISSQRHIPHTARTIVDVCCGPGAGALHMARNFPSTRVAGLDLNDKALKLAELNASLAGVHVDFACSDLYSSLPDLLDGTDVEVIISNPPYIASSTSISGSVPIYSDGGASLGLDVSIRIVKEGSQFLARGGILLLYTGVTILAKSPGQDPFLEWVKSRKEYELLDYRIYHPDMWPEEIGKGVYADAARIQVVGIVLQKQ